MAAWPDLPDDVKRKILHLVKSHRRTPEADAEAEAAENAAVLDVLSGRRRGDLTAFPRVTYQAD